MWSNFKEKVGKMAPKRRPSPAPRAAGKLGEMDDSDDDLDERDRGFEEERNLLEVKIELLIDMLVVRELDRRRELQ